VCGHHHAIDGCCFAVRFLVYMRHVWLFLLVYVFILHTPIGYVSRKEAREK